MGVCHPHPLLGGRRDNRGQQLVIVLSTIYILSVLRFFRCFSPHRPNGTKASAHTASVC